MKQSRSPLAQLFIGFQVILFVVLGLVYYQNNISSVLPNLHGNDFAHNYLAGYLLQHDGDPYNREHLLLAAQQFGIPHVNPYVYPLFPAICFIPLSRFSYPDAQLIWFWMNHLFLLLSIAIIGWQLPKSSRWLVTLLLLGFYSFNYPLVRTLTAGQLNFLLLFLLICTLHFSLKEKTKYLAGFFLGAATLIKLYPGLFIIYYAVRKDYKTVISALTTIVVLIIASMLVWGTKPYIEYAGIIQSMSYGQSVWADTGEVFHVSEANQSLHALCAHLFTVNPVTTPIMESPLLAKLLSTLFSIGVLLSAVWIAYRQTNTPSGVAREQSLFGFILLSALLVPSLMWDHYLVFIPIILVFLLYSMTEQQPTGTMRMGFLGILWMWTAVPYNFLGPGIQKRTRDFLDVL